MNVRVDPLRALQNVLMCCPPASRSAPGPIAPGHYSRGQTVNSRCAAADNKQALCTPDTGVSMLGLAENFAVQASQALLD